MNFDFSFEELPLISENGIQAALVNGMATINADRLERTWEIQDIWIQGFAGLKEKPFHLDFKTHQWLYFAICDALESAPFSNGIERQLDEEIAAAIEEAADRRYDQMRDERMERAR